MGNTYVWDDETTLCPLVTIYEVVTLFQIIMGAYVKFTTFYAVNDKSYKSLCFIYIIIM